jgi:hypothetical protein
MFVLCLSYSKDKRQNAGQSGQRSTDEVEKQNKRIKKIPVGRKGFFSPSRPHTLWNPPVLLINGDRAHISGTKRLRHTFHH